MPNEIKIPASASQLLEEQYRIQMIEQYRQTVALQSVVGLMIADLRDDRHTEPLELARKAKRIADAMCEVMFE